jgi:GNAT superfamily N-acetyltransferase
MTIAIRSFTVDEIPTANAILSAAYTGPTDRSSRVRRYLGLQPDGWILASVDGRPAGVAGAIVYGPLAYIGLVGVLPEFQRRGVARAMMEHVLGLLRERGCEVVLLDASPVGAPLYEKLGFVDDAKTLLFAHDDCAMRPQRSERVSLMQSGDIPALATFDTPIFGADRTAVFASYLVDYPDRSFVARDAEGQVSGFAFAQADTIGPWAARTPEDAEALLAETLPLTYEGSPGVIVPSVNPHAASLLMRYGFSPRRSLRHMRYGGNGPLGQRELLYGQASMAIG